MKRSPTIDEDVHDHIRDSSDQRGTACRAPNSLRSYPRADADGLLIAVLPATLPSNPSSNLSVIWENGRFILLHRQSNLRAPTRSLPDVLPPTFEKHHQSVP